MDGKTRSTIFLQTSMEARIHETRERAVADIQNVRDPAQLEEFRIAYLARKGEVASLFELLKTVSPEERPGLGKSLNELRAFVQKQYDEKSKALSAGNVRPASTDLTLPGRDRFVGSQHPLTRTLDEIKSIFLSLGFSIADGPEIE
ncbi:MAG: phenylalanine--tRNA ligase subunit alpha, partial [Bacteroidota bacterium]